MRVYMAAIEGCVGRIVSKTPDDYIECALISYWYIKDNDEKMRTILKKCKRVIVDSGAHSIQHGAKVSIEKYTRRYAAFIKKWANEPKVEGFFEMDVDNVIGYEKVLELRKILLQANADKIIPVWHHNRGINDFIEMCKQNKGRKVSITGFADGDIKPGQFNLFINTAHHYGCKIHILGFTRFEILKTLNLGKDDSVDSSSWVQNGVYGRIKMMNKFMSLKEFTFYVGLKEVDSNLIRKLNLLSYNNIARRFINCDKSVEARTK